MRLTSLPGVAGLAALGVASFAVTLYLMRSSPVPGGGIAPLAGLTTPATESAPIAPPLPTDAWTSEASDTIEPPPTVDAPVAPTTDDPLQRVLVELKAPDAAQRARALGELRRFDAEATLPVYGRVLANESDPTLRLEALELLAQLRQDPRWRVAAENEMRSRLDDGDESVVSRIRERLDSSAPGDE